jgi:D-methionine transport system permease protein
MSPADLQLFSTALGETAAMVGVAGALSFLLGLPLGLLLVATDRGGIWERPTLNRTVGAIVNAFRSTPFIILLVALIPFTRLVVGTTIGTAAAIVPLTIAATPYFARIAEMSLREVDRGLIEAMRAMGATRWQIVREALVPEALPGLVAGFTVTLVTLIGASAMAGAVGAGGLGDLAIRYGYQRFETAIMLGVIAVLIAIVSSVQYTGDRLARRFDKRNIQEDR